MDKSEIYSAGEFAKLIGKTIRTVQRWDMDGLLVAQSHSYGAEILHKGATTRRNWHQANY